MAVIDKAVVRLSSEQRRDLERMGRCGMHTARSLLHARILLMTDEGETGDGEPDQVVAEAIGVHVNTIARIRKLFAREGLEAALKRKPPTGRMYRKLDGEQEARLVHLACSPAPQGQARWTLKLLAERLVQLEVVPSIDPSTVQRTLKKTASSRG
jgi:transposase